MTDVQNPPAPEAEAAPVPAPVPVRIGRTEPRHEGRVVPITDPVTMTIDGRVVTAQAGELLIDACERAGTYVPRFCYHPRMTAVGMCRMCLVEVVGPRGASLQPSCMVPVAKDMVVSTTTPNVEKAQDGVLEFLLANHPLDCPVCDKGGECPLQDQTVAYGPGESRFAEEKRHYEKPIPISELVLLDRERCILCDRCTRFADEVAGDPLIHFMERGNATQVQTFPDEPFSSYFSGNVVQICPVGALTAKPYRFAARPWDLETMESTCTECAVGCRVTVDTSRNTILRLNGVDVDEVNQGWLCDRGRFGFEAVNASTRLVEPLVRRQGQLTSASWSTALEDGAGILRAAGPGGVAILGGSRLTNEGAAAWSTLLRDGLNSSLVDVAMGRGLGDAGAGLSDATIADVCAPGGTVLWMAADPKEELPVLFLRLRDAVERRGVTLIHLATPEGGSLSKLAKISVPVTVGELGRRMQAVMSADAGADEDAALKAALSGDGPLTVVAGRRSDAEGVTPVLEAVGAVVAARPDAKVLIADAPSNHRGARLAGLSCGSAHGIGEICDGIRAGDIRAVIVLAADPFADAQVSADMDDVLRSVPLIAVDTLPTTATERADVVLPMAAWGETSGTTVSLDGLVTTLQQSVTPKGMARADWLIAAGLGDRLGVDIDAEATGDLTDHLAATVPAFAGITASALAGPDARDGLRVSEPRSEREFPEPGPLPKVSGYSLRLETTRRMYDGSTTVAAARSMANLAAAPEARLNPADAAPLGVGNGDLVTLTSPAGRCSLPARLDDTVAKGAVCTVIGAAGSAVNRLIDPEEPLTEVRLEAGGDTNGGNS